jgi:pimeloyl-ACP methyl ester carboxylesterase
MNRFVFVLLCAVSFGVPAPARCAETGSFRIIHVDRSSDELGLHWSGAGTGLAYTVQERNALDEGLWLTRSDRRPWPTSATQWSAGPNTADVGFYRVLAVPEAERGKTLSVTPLPSLNTLEIGFLFLLAGIPVVPEHAVDAYKIVYETLDPWGGRIQASGAFVLPQDFVGPLPLVSYQHGTLTRTNDAPSADIIERIPGIGFASIGYAVALPDFLGLGDSPGLHPYHHARSQATACVDLLRAVRAWCEANQVPLSNELFLAGYSQGGHATLALQREIETYHVDEFTVTASAPMAGAYDLSGVTADDLLSGRPMPNAYYLLYLLGAYQEVYQVAGSLAELLAAPYDVKLPPLLNGNATGTQINSNMPPDARQILKPEILDAIQTQPDHPFRIALRDNDLTDWMPVSPTRLYHCAGDQDVIFANSEIALAHFHARGATQVELIDPDLTADHGDCVLPSFLLVKDWFDSLRQGDLPP